MTTFAVEGQKWEQIKVQDETATDPAYYVFKNPESERYLTALSPDESPDLIITGIYVHKRTFFFHQKVDRIIQTTFFTVGLNQQKTLK